MSTFLNNMAGASENGDYHTRLGIRGIKRWRPHALPQVLNVDGRPVWEPPILAYNHLIGEEYEKKREAVLKYADGDRARTTEILDIDVEKSLLNMFWDWTWGNIDDIRDSGDSERASFFGGLSEEVNSDRRDVQNEYVNLGIAQKRMGDGTWKIKNHNWGYRDGFSEHEWSPANSDSEGDEIGREYESPSPTNNPRISTSATDAEELNWLSPIDPQAYPQMQSEEDAGADDEASSASSHSNAYIDARSTLSGRDEDEEEETREAKRRRLHL